MKLTAALLFSAATVHASITGTLIDERGKPVAGATIKAYAAEDSLVRRARLVRRDAELAVIATTQSDENGRFKVDAKAPLVELAIEPAGKQPVGLDAPDGHNLNMIVLRTKPQRRLRVTGAGKPVANAVVQGAPFIARSDAEGSVDLPDLTRPSILHAEYAPTLFFAGSDESLSRGEIKLSSGVAIHGKVVSSAGQPVAGATITVAGWPLGVSGAGGSFTIPHAPATWRTMVATEGNRAGVVTKKGAGSYEIRLKPAASITGTAPAGSRVALMFQGDPESHISFVTGANGSFASGPLPAGRYDMYVSRRGDGSSGPNDIVLREGTRATRVVSLKPLSLIRGRVVGEDQQPIAGAYVWSASGGGSARMDIVMTGEKGEFAVRRAEPAFVPINGVKRGYALATSGPLAENKNDLTLVMRRGFPLQVRVTDRREGVEGAFVTLMTAEQEMGMRNDVACDEPLIVNCRMTSSAGAVELRLSEGDYGVRVTGAGIVPVSQPVMALTAKSSPVTIEVDRGVEVSGRVVFADGTPVADAMVSAGGLMIGGRTETDGSFILSNLPSGSVTLTASTGDGIRLQSERTEVRAPSRDVVLTIPTPARIEGRITDKETGAPVTSFHLSVQFRDGRVFSSSGSPMMTSEDGSFALERVPAAPIELHVSAPGYARGRIGNLTTEEGKTLRGVDAQLEKGGQIRGRVTAAGEPVAGAAVRVSAREQRGMTGMDRPVLTDTNGEYFLDSLPLGERTIEVFKEAFVAARKTVEVVRGKETRLDVELDRGHELTGRVTDEVGQAIAGVQVQPQASGMRSNVRAVRTDSSGSFTLGGLEDGRYTLRLSKDGFVMTNESNVVVPATAPLSLRMSRGGTITGHVTGLSAAERASVDVAASKGEVHTRTRTASDGSFTLRGVPDGRVHVDATIWGSRYPRQAGPYWVEVVNGSASPVQIDFSDGFKVTGRVTRSGVPMTSGTLHFSGPGKSRSTGMGTDGTYQVDGLPAGDYSVTLATEAGALFRGRHSVATDSMFDIAVEGSSVRGRVVDAATGAPVSDVTVMTVPSRTNPVMRQARSDSDGRFVLEAMPDGTIDIRVDARQSYIPMTRSITVQGGSAPDIELRLERGQATLFRITDALSGAPLDALIMISSGGKPAGRFGPSRESDGSIRAHLAPGTYKANVTSRGYTFQMVDFTTPGPEVRVALRPGARLILTAAKPTRVRVTPLFGGRPMTPMATPGGTPMEGLAAGDYTVEVMAEDGKSVVRSLPVTLVAGHTASISVD